MTLGFKSVNFRGQKNLDSTGTNYTINQIVSVKEQADIRYKTECEVDLLNVNLCFVKILPVIFRQWL